MTKELYLILQIWPGGLKFSQISLTDEKPDLYALTRGEGQALLFKLEDYDVSSNFGEALRSGELIKNLGNRNFRFEWDENPIDSIKHLETLNEALDNKI